MKIIPPGSIIGIIGGGQLGRMAALAAANLGYKIHIFTPEKDSPASFVSYKTTVAKYTDKKALKKFADAVAVITYEFENIPAESIAFLEKHSDVRPSNLSLHISQNRCREKEYINSLGIKTAGFYAIKNAGDLAEALAKTKNSGILKTSEMGYDGKGQFRIEKKIDAERFWKDTKMKTAVLEEIVNFKKEISVIIARNPQGKTIAFPAAENIHKSGILKESVVPAGISAEMEKKAQNTAIKIAENLGLAGLLAVEFFVTAKNELLVNEIAPRPHNSGHWTMDGCVTSQFEQFVRAICGLSFGSTELLAKKITMHNLLGQEANYWQKALKNPTAKLHLYGKVEAKPGRKMGHVNILEF